MAFHLLVAEARARGQALAIAYYDCAAPGLQDPLRLEGLDDAARIGAADPEQGRQLLMCQRDDIFAIGALHRRDDPFGGPLFDRMANPAPTFRSLVHRRL